MVDLPEVIEGPMTVADIDAAAVALREHDQLSQHCPVAQVLKRMHPEYRWSVGTSEVAVYPGDAVGRYVDEDLLIGRYRLSLETEDWVCRYGVPGTQLPLDNVFMTLPLDNVFMTLKRPPEAGAHSGQE